MKKKEKVSFKFIFKMTAKAFVSSPLFLPLSILAKILIIFLGVWNLFLMKDVVASLVLVLQNTGEISDVFLKATI